MFVELRTYQLSTGAAPAYFDAFGTRGVALQADAGALCRGHYVTEFGPLSQIVALWQHESLEARQRGRTWLYEHAEWRDIIARVSPLVRSIESKLLLPSPAWNPAAG